jgi:hypothetical protein
MRQSQRKAGVEATPRNITQCDYKNASTSVFPKYARSFSPEMTRDGGTGFATQP